jgi:hypothetical protein
MKLLNIETPVTRNFISQILLNVQDFYFHKVGYTSYDEGISSDLRQCVGAQAAESNRLPNAVPPASGVGH